MRSWQDNGMPFYGAKYTALCDHRGWDGGVHYWSGMAVPQMGDQNPDNYNCCPELMQYEGEEVDLDESSLRGLRARLKSSGYTHRGAGARLGMGLSHIRQRLYGQKRFRRGELNILSQLSGFVCARGQR
ncbi:MAG: hypothetical protein C0609_00165 [Deltaproteobacteria bacterium]|nr:MAG: hypothetical protein C0609_00165 [Deltaproteobacteria bacterium]